MPSPRASPDYRGVDFRGHVVYPDGNVQIPVSGLDQRFIGRLGSLIRRLADETPARRIPSAQECRWCDITAADCPERVEEMETTEGDDGRLLTDQWISGGDQTQGLRRI